MYREGRQDEKKRFETLFTSKSEEKTSPEPKSTLARFFDTFFGTFGSILDPKMTPKSTKKRDQKKHQKNDRLGA